MTLIKINITLLINCKLYSRVLGVQERVRVLVKPDFFRKVGELQRMAAEVEERVDQVRLNGNDWEGTQGPDSIGGIIAFVLD